MSEQVRVGLLGCGRIGSMHAELLARRVTGTTLAAVHDTLDEAAAPVAEAYGARHASSAAELIESDDVDAVAICSSTDTHIDLLVQVAAAGKPAFVEKPLSLDLAEVDRGIAAATEAGIDVQVGFNRRFDAAHRHVRDRVAAGDVGEVHLVRMSSRDPDPPPISYIEVSGGIFCDMTIHDFDMARFVTGSEAVEVYATGAVRGSIRPSTPPATSTPQWWSSPTPTARSPPSTTAAGPSTATTSGWRRSARPGWRARTTRARQRLATGTSTDRTAGRCRTSSWIVTSRRMIAEWDAFVAMVHGGPVAGDAGRRAGAAGDGPGRLGLGPRGPPGGGRRDRLNEMPAAALPSGIGSVLHGMRALCCQFEDATTTCRELAALCTVCVHCAASSAAGR